MCACANERAIFSISNAKFLRRLCGKSAGRDMVLPEHAIIIAEELLPSDLLGLDPARIAGFATASGGPTSHVAILAAAMGIPALVATGPAILAIKEGAEIVLDADRGVLHLAPSSGHFGNGATIRRRAQAAAVRRDGLCRGKMPHRRRHAD